MSEPAVLIDATAVPRDRGGVGRYVDSILPALVRLGADITVVCQPYDADVYRASGAKVVAAPHRVSTVAQRLIWEQLRLPRLAASLGVDVVHSPHYTFPVFMRKPRVVTVHDLTFFSHPELHSRMKRTFFSGWIHAVTWFKSIVVTPSQATADEFSRVTGASPKRVVVAHLGYDSSLFSPPSVADIDEFRAAHDLPSGWVAFLGTLEPRKNVPALIDGFVAAVTGVPKSARPALLLAGGQGWDSEVDPAIARAREAGVDVRKMGYLPLQDLSVFLGGSIVVAYPSLGEGFGLPVLEAMATGACVLTTRILSLPEIGGDAVAYTGTSASAISVTLTELLNDEPRRQTLGAAALARAETFTWDACASAHRIAYAKAMGQ